MSPTLNPKLQTLNCSTLIFDFDGTLARLNIDFPMMRQSVLDLVASYGIGTDGLHNLFVLEMIEAGEKLLMKKKQGREKDFARRAHDMIRDIEVEGARRGELFSGIKEMLHDLKAKNIKIGVATRNCREAVLEVFPDIHSLCHSVVTRESTKRVKPHPGHLRVVLSNLGAEAGDSAMIGDHPMDIQVGKDVGTFTVGVLTGYAQAKALSEAGADLIIESATEITRYLP
jgi:phosphoglycolate phosphatase